MNRTPDPYAKFLVVIPAYNSAAYLKDAVASVQAQTMHDWLCVIVDDGSTDDATPQLADELAKADARISVIHQSNSGLPGARNAGWKKSGVRSEFLYFLDADDLVEQDALQVVAVYLDEHPQVACLYGKPLYWFPDTPGQDYLEEMPRYQQNGWHMEHVPPSDPFVSLRTLAANPVIIPSATFFRRSIFEHTGGWDESLNQMCEDIDMSLHIALYGEVHFLNRQVIQYRRHADNMSNDSARWWAGYRQMRAKWEAYVKAAPEHAGALADALTFADLYACHKSWHGMMGSLKRWKLLDAVKFGVQGLGETVTYAINKRRRRQGIN